MAAKSRVARARLGGAVTEPGSGPGLNDWSTDREWIRSRLTQEIRNLTLGVAQGDEVELKRDPVVRTAVASVTQK